MEMLFFDRDGMGLGIRKRRKAVVLVVFGALTFTVCLAGAQPDGELNTFGGEYSELSEGQQRNLDDIYRRVSQLTGEELDPETYYNRLRLTVRTTFEAVTNALEKTQLTDQSGGFLGAALDLTELLETVHGKVEETRGVEQFRIYARFIPDALDKLNRRPECPTRAEDLQVYLLLKDNLLLTFLLDYSVAHIARQ